MGSASSQTVVVVGVTGDAGAGIVRTALGRGWPVVAVARGAARLEALSAQCGNGAALSTMTGSVADDDSARELAAALGDGHDAVVVSVSADFAPAPVLGVAPAELSRLFDANVVAHLAAARHLLPLVRAGGTFLGLGGGMADAVIPRYVPMSVVQAAQRMLYRGLVRELGRESSVRVLEMLVAAMINGARTRDFARPEWITDDEVGAAVCDALEGGDDGPILTVTSPRAGQRR
jgi:NAD(P)-dependent dehydrogenase (short-subunit alcohol dehydrogenase family)